MEGNKTIEMDNDQELERSKVEQKEDPVVDLPKSRSEESVTADKNEGDKVESDPVETTGSAEVLETLPQKLVAADKIQHNNIESDPEGSAESVEFLDPLSVPLVAALKKEGDDVDATAAAVGRGDFEYKNNESDDEALSGTVDADETNCKQLEVRQIIEEVRTATLRLTTKYPLLHQLQVEAFDLDALFRTTERFVEARSDFSSDSRPIHVDIGYHYTCQSSLDGIRLHGLLNMPERVEKSIEFNRHNGSRYGEGVYTADAFYPYSEFGEICLIVALLKGKEGPYQTGNLLVNDCTTIRHGEEKEVTVLARGYQCIPLLKFDNRLFNISPWVDIAEVIYRIHMELQGVIDECFNGGYSTRVSRWRFDTYDIQRMTTRPTKALAYTTLEFNGQQSDIKQQQPPAVTTPFQSPTMTLTYHRKLAFKSEKVAWTHIPETMKVMFYPKDSLTCDGHSTMVVEYSLIDFDAKFCRSGEPESVSAEKRLSHFTTYHPFTKSHCAIVRRLALAFEQGLLDSVLVQCIPHRIDPNEPFDGQVQTMARFMTELSLPMLGGDKYYEIWSLMSNAESSSIRQQDEEKGDQPTTSVDGKLQSS